MKIKQLKSISKSKCPVCKSKNVKFLFDRKDLVFIKSGLIELSNKDKICRRCGYIGSFKHPSQKLLSHYYRSKIVYKVDKPDYNLKNQIKFLKKNHHINDDILEIGSGTNFLYEAMRELNYKFYVSEDFNSLKKKYDAVLINHVLEHVANPIKFLKELKAKIKNNGTVIVEVPDIKKLLSVNSKTYFFSSEHIHHFTENSLKNIFFLAGFNFKFREKKLISRINSIRMIFQKSSMKNEKVKFLYSSNIEKKLLNYNSKKNENISSFLKKIHELMKKNNDIFFWGLNTVFLKIFENLNDRSYNKKLKLIDSQNNQILKKLISNYKIELINKEKIKHLKNCPHFVICAFTWSISIEQTIKTYRSNKMFKIINPKNII